jgi:hypothetical protein
MGSKSLIAAPLWADRYRNEPASFHAMRHNKEENEILHYQDFDVHMSDNPLVQMLFRVTGAILFRKILYKFRTYYIRCGQFLLL